MQTDIELPQDTKHQPRIEPRSNRTWMLIVAAVVVIAGTLCVVGVVSAASQPRSSNNSESAPGSDENIFKARRLSASDSCNANGRDGECDDGKIICLRQNSYGTYIIDGPGTYVVMENIVFHPDRALVRGVEVETPTLFPPHDSDTHTEEDGYKLGYFAAIAVGAENVVIDLNGCSISQSLEHTLRQRFFSIIELARRPFVPEAGPPQFAALATDHVPARNVVIHDGTLGLSSHSGIHGNGNSGIRIKNVKVVDFETTGMQFNGASELEIVNCDIGPALGSPQSSGPIRAMGTLSLAQFLLRIATDCDDCDALLENVHEYKKLNEEVERFIEHELSREPPQYDMSTDEWTQVPRSSRTQFNDPDLGFNSGFGDGSAMYGIIVHRPSPAIFELGECANSTCKISERDVVIKKTRIHDLVLIPEEVISVTGPDGVVMNPDGGVVHVSKLMDNRGRYRATPLSDAQFKMMKLKKDNEDELDDENLFARYGAIYVPDAILEWASSKNSAFDEIFETTDDLTLHCSRDSMAHANKGVIGLRLEFVRDIVLDNLEIYGLTNRGDRSTFLPDVCTGESDITTRVDGISDYKGSDVRGIVTTRVKDMRATSKDTTIFGLRSLHGAAFGVELREGTTYTSIDNIHFDHIQGATPDDSFNIAVRSVDETPTIEIERNRRLAVARGEGTSHVGCPFMRAQASSQVMSASTM